MQHFLLLFGVTFASAFLATAPPGLLNVNAAKTSVEKGRTNGIMFGLGVGIMVMLQAYLAVRISKYLSRNPEAIEILMQVAVLIFAILAIFFFIKGKKELIKPIEHIRSKKRGSFTKGLFLEAINLLAIPYYSGLNVFFAQQGFMNFKVIDEVVFIFAAGTGTFSVMYLYVLYFNKMERKTNRFSKNANFILSAIMVLLLIITLFRIFYSQ